MEFHEFPRVHDNVAMLACRQHVIGEVALHFEQLFAPSAGFDRRAVIDHVLDSLRSALQMRIDVANVIV